MSGFIPPQGPPQGPPGMSMMPQGPMSNMVPHAPPGRPTGPQGPSPLPPIPGLIPQGMRPQALPFSQEQMLAFLLPPKNAQDDTPTDPDDHLPPGLRKYAAGLRPTVRPVGAAWQQEIVFERLGKDDQEIEAIARHYFKSAQEYDAQLSIERIKASQYYVGKEEAGLPEGRSKLVLTVVRDTIRQTLPSLLRLFTAVEDPCSFEPVSSEIAGNDQLATALSRQATDYCKWALFTANDGWTILHDALLDALTRKAGWVRWHWGKRQAVRTEVSEGVLLPRLQMLLSEPGTEAQRIVRRPMLQSELQAFQKTQDGMLYLSSGAPAELWSATITRTAAQAWPKVEHVAAEAVWVVADATTVADAKALFHVRQVPASDLIEMGLPEDAVLAAGRSDLTTRARTEAIARNPTQGYALRQSPPSDKSMMLVRYAEGWIRCDTDGDNKAELIKVHLLGNANKLVQWERTDEIPFACFVPYREPGSLIGLSQADMVMDLQRIESRVMRATLDSLAQSMFPRTVMTVGQANMADVKQTSIGAIIRVAQQGAVQELAKPFAGKEALPIMEALEAIRESRTGITRASAGLTVDELQSTAPIAVSQQTAAAQDRLDMVARTLAETGLAPLYSGLLRMLARQQDRPNTIRIRGQWLDIDPRALATQWECSVNVGGKGMPQERLQMLAQIAMKQEQIMQMGGLNNPLCGVPEYRNTLARMLETVSISDVSSYFKALPPDFTPPPTQQPPNTDLILAQVQGQKTAADVENDRAKAQTDRAKLLMEDDRERDRAALDAWSKTWIAGAQFGSPAPSFDEFQTAMRSKVPPVALLGSVPQPTSPQPPATGAPQQPQQPNRPQTPPLGGPQAGATRPPPMGVPPRPPIGPSGPPDPATAAAVRGALRGLPMPGAYGQIAQRAALSPLFGPGGPPPQQPPGPQGA